MQYNHPISLNKGERMNYSVVTPALIFDEAILQRNVLTMRSIEEQTGVKVLYALKASYAALSFLGQQGVIGEVSSLFEAQLAVRQLNQKSHAFLVAMSQNEWEALQPLISHVSFNSFSQGNRFAGLACKSGISAGIRVNPRVQVSSHGDYDPCEKGGRFGVSIYELPERLPDWVSGFHVHALCENGAEDLVRVLDMLEQHLRSSLANLSWINLGGGHLITEEGYNRDLLVARLKSFRERFPNLSVYLEPGAAWVWGAGKLVVTVEDVVSREGIQTAIIDASFRAHMSDFLIGEAVRSLNLTSPALTYVSREEYFANSNEDRSLLYRIGGSSCAACDFKEFYRSKQPLTRGDHIIFENMGHYVDVTYSMFNGVRPPSLYYRSADGDVRLLKEYRDTEFLSFVL
jgi:carboxynorspermidine decarboxylase